MRQPHWPRIGAIAGTALFWALVLALSSGCADFYGISPIYCMRSKPTEYLRCEDTWGRTIPTWRESIQYAIDSALDRVQAGFTTEMRSGLSAAEPRSDLQPGPRSAPDGRQTDPAARTPARPAGNQAAP